LQSFERINKNKSNCKASVLLISYVRCELVSLGAVKEAHRLKLSVHLLESFCDLKAEKSRLSSRTLPLTLLS
jgi:hypothetical protein